MTAEEIKSLRERTGLNQREFGRVIGASQQAVSGWETGRTQPRVHGLIRALGKIEPALRKMGR